MPKVRLTIQDHLMINKCIFSTIRLNFFYMCKKHFDTFLFFDKKKTLKAIGNVIIICPNHVTIFLLINIIYQGRIFTNKSKDKLEDYVSFTRANFHPQVKSWCDWCSIANGYLSFLINAINEYFGMKNNDPKNLDIKKLLKIKALFSRLKIFALIKEDDFSYSHELTVKPKELFPKIDTNSSENLRCFFETITNGYNIVQTLERQWCPFEHMKRIAMLETIDKKRYDRYLKCEGFEDIIEAGKIIFRFKSIKCHECVEAINNNIVKKEMVNINQNDSIYSDIFKLFCRLSKEEDGSM